MSISDKKDGNRLTFYLTKEVSDLIRKEAEKENRSMSNFIETLLRRIFKI